MGFHLAFSNILNVSCPFPPLPLLDSLPLSSPKPPSCSPFTIYIIRVLLSPSLSIFCPHKFPRKGFLSKLGRECLCVFLIAIALVLLRPLSVTDHCFSSSRQMPAYRIRKVFLRYSIRLGLAFQTPKQASWAVSRDHIRVDRYPCMLAWSFGQ